MALIQVDVWNMGLMNWEQVREDSGQVEELPNVRLGPTGAAKKSPSHVWL
jgi:hypothetical protein